MIYTVRIDDQTQNGQMLIKQLSCHREGIEIINPAPPHGYMTLEELRTNALDRLEKLYKENGLLK
jgi:hypothetical protein